MNEIFSIFTWTGRPATFCLGLSVALTPTVAVAAGTAEAAKPASL